MSITLSHCMRDRIDVCRKIGGKECHNEIFTKLLKLQFLMRAARPRYEIWQLKNCYFFIRFTQRPAGKVTVYTLTVCKYHK